MIFQLIRFLMVITGTVLGVSVGYGIINEYPTFITTDNPEMKLAALLGCVGYLLCSMAGRELQLWLESRLESINSQELLWSSVGFFTGLVGANLLFFSLYFVLFKGMAEISFDNRYYEQLKPLLYLMIPLFINTLFGYIGSRVVWKYRQAQLPPRDESERVVHGKLLDTSAIIDGRVGELFNLGFLEGRIIVPKFVVSELQFVADSADMDKRAKGRRGLDLLNELTRKFPDLIALSNHDPKEVQDVDGKLIEVARNTGMALITIDYNLKRVAELQKVKVLNLNDLINALKPVALTGELLTVKIIKPGKEPGQGVGYLEDGTMIVVEDGGDAVGRQVETTVSNILQTSAGRIIFTRQNRKTSTRQGG